MSLLTDREIEDAYNAALGQTLRPQDATAVTKVARSIEAAVIKKLATVSVEPPYLCKSTRFKMSFFQNEDGQGGYTDGTHVTCFEAFEDELDGKWVALVPAEDDRHIADFKTALAAARVQENEKAATLALSMEGAAGQDIADAIRALIGGAHGES